MFGTVSLTHYLHGITQPELLPSGSNLFGYVGGDPLNFYDQQGEVPPQVIGAAIGAGISFGGQFWKNGGFGDLANGDFGEAWNKASKCTDWADVGVSAASGALFGGAFGNLSKATKGLREANRIRKINPVVVSPYFKQGIIKGVINESAEAAIKGAGATLIGLGKNAAGLPRNMCE
jgi:hypothetical protein